MQSNNPPAVQMMTKPRRNLANGGLVTVSSFLLSSCMVPYGYGRTFQSDQFTQRYGKAAESKMLNNERMGIFVESLFGQHNARRLERQYSIRTRNGDGPEHPWYGYDLWQLIDMYGFRTDGVGNLQMYLSEDLWHRYFYIEGTGVYTVFLDRINIPVATGYFALTPGQKHEFRALEAWADDPRFVDVDVKIAMALTDPDDFLRREFGICTAALAGECAIERSKEKMRKLNLCTNAKAKCEKGSAPECISMLSCAAVLIAQPESLADEECDDYIPPQSALDSCMPSSEPMAEGAGSIRYRIYLERVKRNVYKIDYAKGHPIGFYSPLDRAFLSIGCAHFSGSGYDYKVSDFRKRWLVGRGPKQGAGEEHSLESIGWLESDEVLAETCPDSTITVAW